MKTKKWLWYAAAALLCFIAIAAFAWSAANKSKNTNAVAVANKNVNSAANSNAAAGQNANSSLANTNTNTNNNTNASANTNASQIVTAAKTIDETAITLVQKSTGHCEALAPLDWSFVTNAEGSGADLYSADKSLKAAMHAGWGISAVYTYMYPTVDSFLSAWLGYAYTGSFTNGGITLAAAQDVYEGFIQREFTTSNGRKGVAIYKTYNFGDPTMYVVSVYIADTASDKWETSGAQPFYVALTIRCVTQLRPVTSSVDPYTSDPGSSSDNPEVGLSDKWTEAIMGYENVYSPTTGEHYEAPLTSEWQGGPQGTGYYRSLPNGGYEKLEPGFGEY
ncbi:MAG: hypothetical protein WC528_01625 [Patescibacteria group bacterium]